MSTLRLGSYAASRISDLDAELWRGGWFVRRLGRGWLLYFSPDSLMGQLQ